MNVWTHYLLQVRTNRSTKVSDTWGGRVACLLAAADYLTVFYICFLFCCFHLATLTTSFHTISSIYFFLYILVVVVSLLCLFCCCVCSFYYRNYITLVFFSVWFLRYFLFHLPRGFVLLCFTRFSFSQPFYNIASFFSPYHLFYAGLIVFVTTFRNCFLLCTRVLLLVSFSKMQ